MAESSGYSQRIKDYWGQAPPDPGHSFYLFPPLRDYFHRCLTGEEVKSPRAWWEEWVIKTYLANKVPVEEALSICSGFGEIERILAGYNVFKHCTALDISPGATEQAATKAREAGHANIDYRVADLNIIELESQKYDTVWSVGALHHLTNLEHVLSQIKKSLKPGGYLFANEYIGPNHQAKSARQLEIINSVIHLIPPRNRDTFEWTQVPFAWARTHWGRWLWNFWNDAYSLRVGRPTMSYYHEEWPPAKKVGFRIYSGLRRLLSLLIPASRSAYRYGKVLSHDPRQIQRSDPSEGVRSSEIIPLIKEVFDDVEVHHYNGSILHYALDHRFYDTYDSQKSEDRELLDLLIRIEETMTRLGETNSENAHIVARKP